MSAWCRPIDSVSTDECMDSSTFWKEVRSGRQSGNVCKDWRPPRDRPSGGSSFPHNLLPSDRTTNGARAAKISTVRCVSRHARFRWMPWWMHCICFALRSVTAAAMFSEQERLHALGLYSEKYNQEEVADIIGCSPRSLRRWVGRWEDAGTVWQSEERENAHFDAAIFSSPLAAAVKHLVEAEPAAFLKDHVKLLKELRSMSDEYADVHASAATVYRVLRYHGYTRKKIERLFHERNLNNQRQFAQTMSQIPMRCIVSIDETHKSGEDSYRKYGRSQRNSSCVLLDRDPRTIPRTSTMMAVSASSGVLWMQTVVLGPAQNSDDWRLFLEDLMQVEAIGKYQPNLPWDLQPANSVLLFDNAGIHDQQGDDFLQENGVYYIRLPAYSPNLQPIEGVFNELKRHIRDLVYFDSRYQDKPRRLLADAAMMLTHAQIMGQFVRVQMNMDALLLQ